MTRRLAGWSVLLLLMSALCRPGPVLAADRVRLGWQVPWATQGQLVMGLKHTTIADLLGLDIDYVGFTYGGPQTRAALAGQLDVLLTADQPALVLLARDPSFRIVARMMYNRVCIYVPPASAVRALDALAGKTVMGPTGAAAERIALAAIQRAGVDLRSVRFGSLDMEQQSALLARAQSRPSWPGVDALYGFDPLPAVFEEQGKARMLHCGNVVSMVLASRDMVGPRRAELERFLAGFLLSWYYFAQEPQAVNALFSKDSRLNVSPAVLDKAASVEPNRWVKSLDQLRLDFVPDDVAIIEGANAFLVERAIIKQPVDIRAHMDLAPLRAVLARPDLADLMQKVKMKSGAGP